MNKTPVGIREVEEDDLCVNGGCENLGLDENAVLLDDYLEENGHLPQVNGAVSLTEKEIETIIDKKFKIAQLPRETRIIDGEEVKVTVCPPSREPRRYSVLPSSRSNKKYYTGGNGKYPSL